jgi:hypothetical protein
MRVEEVQKYEWPFCAVSMELQKMTLDQERFVHINCFLIDLFSITRNDTTKLSVFQLYLSEPLEVIA